MRCSCSTRPDPRPGQLARAGREVAHRLDPDVADRLARAGREVAVERRELYLSANSWTGMWDRRATLDPLTGAALRAEIETLATLCGQLERTGRSTDGSWLSPALIRELACDADIVPVVLGGKSEPLDVGCSR